jgi:hypothetical protein
MSMRSQKSSRRESRQDVNDRDLVVYDGQTAVGFIRRFSDIFAAYDSGGKLVGRFANQRAAVAAIPAYRDSAPGRHGRSRAGRSVSNAATTGPKGAQHSMSKSKRYTAGQLLPVWTSAMEKLAAAIESGEVTKEEVLELTPSLPKAAEALKSVRERAKAVVAKHKNATAEPAGSAVQPKQGEVA